MLPPAHSSVPGEFFPPFDVSAPVAQNAACVFCSPHSGRTYPQSFLTQSRLDPSTLRKSEDCLVDRLFAGVTRLGAPQIAARFPRAYLDLNREPYELDPELVADPLPAHANSQSIRVAGGLGTVARVVADGEEIYHQQLRLKDVIDRIEALYFPFHAELTRLIEATRRHFGYAVLIDCHSMPSAAMAPSGGPRPDIVIGDRFGTSCDPRLTRHLREGFACRGYDVQLNRPYAGGFITEHHGRPGRGVHAVQLEINRGLYLDERSFRENEGYAALEADLMAIAADLFAALPQLFEHRAAAE
jgi:N-formylglutamate amidohydrolase